MIQIIPTGPNVAISPELEAFYRQSIERLNAIDGNLDRMAALANLVASFCTGAKHPGCAADAFVEMLAQCLNAAVATMTPASDVRN